MRKIAAVEWDKQDSIQQAQVFRLVILSGITAFILKADKFLQRFLAKKVENQ